MEFKAVGSGEKNGYRVLYKNADIIDPESGYRSVGNLITNGKTIEDFGSNVTADDADEVIDCQGKLLMPGIVDIHVHFRVPGQEEKETIITGSNAAVAGGITTVVCQPNTNPPIDNKFVCSYLNEQAQTISRTNMLWYATITKREKGKSNMLNDMELLANEFPDRVVGFTDDGLPVEDSLIMRKAMEHAIGSDLLLAQHAEDLSITNGGAINEGKVSQELGVKDISWTSESIMVARDVQLSKLTGARYHVLHVSSAETVNEVRRAKENGLRVTCEVTPHHLALTEEAVKIHGAIAKMNPPLRTEEDRQALLQGLKDGTIDCIATDHAPHEKKAKDLPIEQAAFGVIGLETMLPLSLELYHNGFMTLDEVLGKITYKPADIIKQGDKGVGRIKKGGQADLTLVNLDEEWTIKIDEMHSLSKNSPFDGRKAKGKVKLTTVMGVITYRNM